MAQGMTTILDQPGVRRALTRIAHEILEHNKGIEQLVLVGIRSGGDHIAAELAALIQKIEGGEIPLGAVDIGMYRDDIASRGAVPVGKTDIPFDLEGKKVVLVDDVLFTGRTIRAAMDAIIDLGRPQNIQLATLVDRGHRELRYAPTISAATFRPRAASRSRSCSTTTGTRSR